MDDLDCTFKQKMKRAVLLLREEAYQWWLTVKESSQPDQITWEFFKSVFQGKYMCTSYVDARRKEFLNLTQGDRSVAEYKEEFLRLSRYAKGIVVTDYECCVQFKDSLRDSLRVLIAPQRECKATERLNRERERGRNKKDYEPSNYDQRSKRRTRVDGPVRAGPPIATTGLSPCAICGKSHAGMYWRRTGACQSCGSIEHRLRECPRRPDQRQVFRRGNVQPPRGGQQLPRGHS
ncbi:uncharacterized protein [Gossypium hirsutum]|uniref:Retrotransposon gag domain-containing protein n=1 Tax=Gossypium hirsutum TaxID=3635 RepID=A0A1U8JDX3_GOSHI|nr:uncharacterized protein LOC107905839 [Gossypium hirsutum]